MFSRNKFLGLLESLLLSATRLFSEMTQYLQKQNFKKRVLSEQIIRIYNDYYCQQRISLHFVDTEMTQDVCKNKTKNEYSQGTIY